MANRAGSYRFHIAAIGLVLVSAGGPGSPACFAQESAAQLMAKAHEGRAVWRSFPGFQADVRATRDGQSSSGKLTVAADGTVTLKLNDSVPADWADRTLRSVISHRLSDDAAISDVEFADTQTAHPLGRLIRSQTPAEKSLWRVQGDVLTEVHRVSDTSRFIISLADVTRNVEGKHLPHSYTVTTWSEPSGALKSTRQIYNVWTRLGEFDLPARLLAATSSADGVRQVDEIVLTEHRLGSTGAQTSISSTSGSSK